MGKFGKKNHVNLNPLSYNIMLLGESKVGKEQPVSEPVLTEDGWKPMGEITIGTKVFGEDGNLYNVTGVYPQGVKDVYEITFRDGTKTRCGLEHLWTVVSKKQRENNRKYNRNNFMVLSLKDILKDYKRKDSVKGIEIHKYSVPINKPIQFKNKCNLEIDPYALGLLLGDGGFTGSVITFTNSEDELFESLECSLKNLDIYLSIRNFDNHKQANLCSHTSVNKLRIKIDEYGLLSCNSREKFIPKEYLYSSVEDRALLLSGIINTDGSVLNKNISVTTYSCQLAKDVTELARSLGFIATFHEYDRTEYDNDIPEIEYHVNIISSDYSILTLSEKHLNRLQDKEVEYVKTIVDIKLIGKEESQCIMVDNPNHLYITNDYIVTHNTTLIKEVCEQLVGDNGYMFLECGQERGADAIEGISYINCPEWNMDYDELTNSAGFIDVCEDIIENKTSDYPDLKVVIWDTYDHLINIAESESIRLWNRYCRENNQPEKIAKSINAAWGGFGKGEKKAMELMFDVMGRLRSVGVSTIVIGHVKIKEVSDVVSGETYQVLTSDQQQNYFNALKKNLHFLGLAYIDRQIVKEKTGKKNIVTKQEITKNKVSAETRKIKFRDDSYAVDSGSRFADIVPEIEMNASEFIKALTDAILNEQKKSGKSVSETKAEQDKIAKLEEDKITKAEKAKKEKKQLDEIVSQIIEYFVTNKTNIDIIKPILAKCKEYGYNTPKDIDSIDVAKDILTMIEE